MTYEHRFIIKMRDSGDIVRDLIRPEDLQSELDLAMDKFKQTGINFSQPVFAVVLTLVQMGENNGNDR